MSKKILCIEDNPSDRTLLRSLLEENGYQFFEARNGRVGLIIYKNQSPDLILLDIEMPSVDGYQFILHLKEEYPDMTTPIIIISSHEDKKDIFHRHNIKDFIPKPIDSTVLLELIKQRLSEEETA